MSSNCHILSFAASSPFGEAELSSRASLFVQVERGSLKRRNHIVTLYDELRPSLMAYLSGLGLSVDEAEDIIQESFLRLVRHLAANRKDENFRGWLFRVAHNLTMDLFRSGRRYLAQTMNTESSPDVDVIDTSLGPEERAIKQQELRRVWAAMARLTEQQRYAVLLRAEGLRYREIGTVLGMNTQRVAELVQRALARLAGEL